MRLNLFWLVIALANLADEIITMVAVSASRDAEL
jgi:hypothetical protein